MNDSKKKKEINKALSAVFTGLFLSAFMIACKKQEIKPNEEKPNFELFKGNYKVIKVKPSIFDEWSDVENFLKIDNDSLRGIIEGSYKCITNDVIFVKESSQVLHFVKTGIFLTINNQENDSIMLVKQ